MLICADILLNLIKRFLLAFPMRDSEEHKQRSAEYASLSPEARQKFLKEHSARYYELSRLPYFDPIRMTVVDPMHNILLGN